jgi:GH15 family glucan-1,4-alpha-glucosidase
MAWVAVDRAIRLARRLEMPCPLERWKALRRAMRERIEREGVDGASGAFVQAFGSRAVDASALLIPEVGFVPRHDPRVRATVDRIESELCRDGFVYRYLDTNDGLPGGEGAFLICSFWLVDNLVFSGQRARACDLFEHLISHANDVGLLAEQFDPVAGEQLGNFPQAFSHMGLINSAIQLGRPDGEASPVAGGAVAGSALS